MGTLWISRMAHYSNHPYALASAEHIIRIKIKSQCRFAQIPIPVYKTPKNKNNLLLLEGRVASHYWRHYRNLVPSWTHFKTRRSHAVEQDIVNRLLDLGYHYLKDAIAHILKAHDISPAIGLLHVAKTDASTPLVYDLMELFRVDIVDREVLHYLRFKKKPMTQIPPGEIGHFLSRIKRRLERNVYLKNFRQCHSYRYAMEIQILRFIYAVNHLEIFHPIHIPTRHDGRCARTKKVDTPQI